MWKELEGKAVQSCCGISRHWGTEAAPVACDVTLSTRAPGHGPRSTGLSPSHPHHLWAVGRKKTMTAQSPPQEQQLYSPAVTPLAKTQRWCHKSQRKLGNSVFILEGHVYSENLGVWLLKRKRKSIWKDNWEVENSYYREPNTHCNELLLIFTSIAFLPIKRFIVILDWIAERWVPTDSAVFDHRYSCWPTWDV